MPSALPEPCKNYHWMLGNLDARADWFENAIDQHDPIIPGMLR